MARTTLSYIRQTDSALAALDSTEDGFPWPTTVDEALSLAALYKPGDWGHDEIDAIIGGFVLLAAHVYQLEDAE